NELIGPVWTSVLGCTVLLLLLQPTVRFPAAAAVAFAVLLCGIDPVALAIPDHMGQPDLVETTSWSQQDPYLLRALDRGAVVYDEQFPSLSVSTRNSSAPAEDWNDAWAGGYTPRWFVDNLVTGRYALVSPVFDWGPGYTSDFGAYDRSVPWKINLLLHTGYTEVTDPDSGTPLFRPSPKLADLRWFAGCFGPYQARGAGVAVRLRGNGGLVCIAAGSLHLTLARLPQTQLVMTLVPGHGAVTLKFRRAIPRVLRVTPLDRADLAVGPPSDIGDYGSAVGRCLASQVSTSSITLQAAAGVHGVRCVAAGGRAVLDVPVSQDASDAHVSLLVAAADSPRIVATGADGSSAPFTLLDLTPGDINSL
ncbi:MAG TPA: hypothetical protein VED63_13180, partial [Acidimicrobiales bacterium]|nr:hypothetical protein [Acidimicrobiales bacterium]